MIKVFFVYDHKVDGRYKSRLVASGNMTPAPLESVYSGVVSLRTVRVVAFAAELNGLDLWSSDIANAYLESYTEEKVCIIAGDEFGPELMGCLLVIIKALYGLRRSGQAWHLRCAAVLKDLGFVPCKADPDLWMREMDDHYEYIGIYVDDLEIASRDPKAILEKLKVTYRFILKGSGPMKYHLGCNFERDADGTLCQSPTKYIVRMIDNYVRLFGTQPKEYTSPLERGDHPELDTSDELDPEGIAIYQSLIGSVQWVVSLGRMDVQTAVMTMSGFRTAPREGHLTRVKRIIGYLSKMRHGGIRYRTERPDLSFVPEDGPDWSDTPYFDAYEELPDDAPTPLGKTVDTLTYIDANLYHDFTNGRSVTGTLHFLNKTPIDWYSKKQNTVETSTYGSEAVAARTGSEQIMDLRTTLRYMGIPIGKSLMFGDNESVVISTTIPHSKLGKRHTALSYHRVRQAQAAGIFRFFHIPGSSNPADILSKHWGHQQIWPVLRPLLFWAGNVGDIDLS